MRQRKSSRPLFWLAMRKASVARISAFTGNSGCRTKLKDGNSSTDFDTADFVATLPPRKAFVPCPSSSSIGLLKSICMTGGGTGWRRDGTRLKPERHGRADDIE